MRAALLGPTVGQTRRGYERFLTDLHRVLREDGRIEATLFKGAGNEGRGEVVVPHITRTGWLARAVGDRLRYPRYHLQFLTFALAAARAIERGGFDVVHYIDPPLGRLLRVIRSVTGSAFRTLFTNAGPVSHDGSRDADHIHCLTPRARDEALACGVAKERISMIPVGVDPGRFRKGVRREAIRERLGIPKDVFVILSVASLNRHHKRIDYLIEEVAQLPGEVLLWIDGGIHPDGDRTIVDLGRRLLGNRFRHGHVESHRLFELYAASDVFVSAALDESFGMAIVEAMITGVPVVTHDSRHFRWLTGNAGHCANLRVSGNLASLLTDLAKNGPRHEDGDAASTLKRFDWRMLVSGYVNMYRAAATGSTSPSVPGEEHTRPSRGWARSTR